MNKILILIILWGSLMINAKDQEVLTPENHHYMGIEMNIQTWNLLGKNDRTKQDNIRMINFALASQYHWYKSPKWQPVNAQRGEWMISHVYAILGMSEQAVKHAELCLKMTKEQDLKDFDLAYAYEAMARAYAAKKLKLNAKKYYALAKEAAAKIKESQNKKYFEGDFSTEPWYDLNK